MKINASPLLRHLQLRPHGERLLTPSAEFWFFSARILVFAMAIAEAIAWGYLGFLFGEDSARWLGAAFAGTIIFSVVWMIDVSLITLDRAGREHAEEILGQKRTSYFTRTLRGAFTFVLRVGLLIGSLTITAPYLAQIVFHRDIQRVIDAEATKALNDCRLRLANTFDKQLESKNAEIEARRSALEREVAGKGLSGRYGVGPAAKALAADIAKLESERDAQNSERQNVLSAFGGLARDWRRNRNRLAADYNVQLPQTSVLENNKALDELRQTPENRSTERAIQAFLAFIFTGLLLLKLFEPSSVRLYLSEVLQQEFNSYLAGTFDLLLPATERSTVSGFNLPPQRLFDFLVKVWVPARKAEEGDAELRARKLASERGLQALEDMRAEIDREVNEAKSELRKAHATADKAATDFENLKSAILIVEGDIRQFETNLVPPPASVELQNRSSLKDDESRLEYDRKRLEIQSSRKVDLATAHLALNRLRAKHALIAQNLERATTDVGTLVNKVRDKNTELAGVMHRIRDVRGRAADAVRDQCETIIETPENYRTFGEHA